MASYSRIAEEKYGKPAFIPEEVDARNFDNCKSN